MLPPDATTPPEPNAPSWRLATVLPRLIISLLIGGGFVWVMRAGGIPILPPAGALRSFQLWGLFVYAPLCWLATFVRTYRWVYLLRPMRPELSGVRVLGIGLVGLSAVVFAPLRMGEVIRPWLLAQDREIAFMQAFGSVAAERIVDGLLLMLLLAASLLSTTPLSPLPDHIGTLAVSVSIVPTLARGSLLVFGSLFAAMALFFFWRASAHRVVYAVIGVVSKPLAGFVTAQVERLSDSLHFLLSPRWGVAFVRDSLVYWAVTAASVWVLLHAAGVEADLAQSCVLLGVMGLATVLPSAPGFFGTYQMGAYCGLALFFPESTVLGAGAVFTFMAYVTQLVTSTLCALVGMWIMAKTAPARASTAAFSASTPSS